MEITAYGKSDNFREVGHRNEGASAKIGDLFYLISGFAFKGADFRKSGGIPVLKIKNVKANRVVLNDLHYVDKDFLKLRADKIVRDGDILITVSGNRSDK